MSAPWARASWIWYGRTMKSLRTTGIDTAALEREAYLVAVEEAFEVMERRERVLTLASLRQEDNLQ